MELEFLYEAKVRVLQGVDIGLVPEGRRIDFPFSGEVNGPKIRGKMEGVDYVTIRLDGALLHVHGIITTDGGDRISVEVSAFTIPSKDGGPSIVKGVLSFRTSSKELFWLNTTQGIEEGFSDMKRREL